MVEGPKHRLLAELARSVRRAYRLDKEGFDRGEFNFVYGGENTIVGMYRLQFADEQFWGERCDRAGYVHSFTTGREHRGRGLGYRILCGIENELSENGFDYMRLDCSPDIKRLCEYYEDFGFEPKEIVVVQGYRLRLYEKKLNI